MTNRITATAMIAWPAPSPSSPAPAAREQTFGDRPPQHQEQSYAFSKKTAPIRPTAADGCVFDITFDNHESYDHRAHIYAAQAQQG